jgi:hypothetical protein
MPFGKIPSISSSEDVLDRIRLLVHVFGRIAAAFFYLIFNS